MKVYAATEVPIILLPGSERRSLKLKKLVKQFLISVGALAVFSIALQLSIGGRGGQEFPPQISDAAPRPVPTRTPQPETIPELGGVVEAIEAAAPGLTFFLGGVVALVMAFAWMYRKSKR